MADHGALFHLLPLANPVAHFGWMGVDLFFVLSGYLIGGQLLRPFAAGQPPRIGLFYLRRAFRILPAYLVVLTFYFTWTDSAEQVSLQPPWQFLTFTWNLFADVFFHKTFSHVWSLCVEEHFYLLTPLLLLLVMRRPAAWKAIVIFVTLLIGGMALRGYLWLHDVAPAQHHVMVGGKSFDELFFGRIYYPTWTRLDGLLDGVALAAIRLFRPQLWARLTARGTMVMAVGALAMALAFYLCWDQRTFLASVFGFPVLSFGLACFVAAAAGPGMGLGRLRVPGATAVAAVAFSTYLVHVQVFYMLTKAIGYDLKAYGELGFIPCALAALAVGTALYLCVERPFLRLRDRLLQADMPQPLPPALAGGL